MKAKQISDLNSAISSNATVADLESKKHVHTGTLNKISKSNGSGNFVDSQITDTGGNIAIADAVIDANVLIAVQTARTIVQQLKSRKTDGDATALNLIADAINSGINYGLKISASNSTSENVALSISSGKSIFGGTTGDNSAIVEMVSTNAGLLIPRMTTTQRTAISTPAKGLIVYDTTLNDIFVNIGTGGAPSWIGLKSVGITGSGTPNRIPRFDTTQTIANGAMNDDGTRVWIGGATTTDAPFYVYTTDPYGIKSETINTNDTKNGVGIVGISQGSTVQRNIGILGHSENSLKNFGIAGSVGDIIWQNLDISVLADAGIVGIAVGDAGTNQIMIGLFGKADASTPGVSTLNNVALWLQASGAGGKNVAVLSENDVPSIFGGGLSEVDNSAILKLHSTTKGFLLPRMTTAQKNTITQPATGLMLFDTNINQIQINTGTTSVPVWTGVGGSGLFGALVGNYVPRAISVNTLTQGSIYDDGTNVAIGINGSGDTKFWVQGSTTQRNAIMSVNQRNDGDAFGITGISNGANTGTNKNVGVYGSAVNGVLLIGVYGTAGTPSITPDVGLFKNIGGLFTGNGDTGNELQTAIRAISNANNSARNVGINIVVSNAGTGGAVPFRIETGADNTGKALICQNSTGDVGFFPVVQNFGTPIPGDIPIFDANGNLINDAELWFDFAGNTLNIGGTNDAVSIGSGICSVTNSENPSVLQLANYSGTSGITNVFSVFKANGTQSAPTNLLIGSVIYERQKFAYNGSAFAQVFSELVTATTNHSSIVRGISWEIQTVNGTPSSAKLTRLTIDGDGHTRVKNGNLRIDDGQIGFKTYTNIASTATSRTIDFNAGNTHEIDLDTASGNVTITFANMIDGTPYLLNVIQGATPREITFSQSVRWSGGASGKPTFASLTNNQETLISIVYLNGKFIASAVVNHS
jgi:hypothetical protein